MKATCMRWSVKWNKGVETCELHGGAIGGSADDEINTVGEGWVNEYIQSIQLRVRRKHR
jgi:hypothetical protein